MKLSLNISKEQVIKILKSACISGIAAAIIYAVEALTNLDFGIFNPLIAAFSPWLVNIVKVYLKI